jgi:predicted Na+-dependent transporter
MRIDVLKRIEQYFWVMLIGAIALGFSLPSIFQQFEQYVVYIIMTIMGVLYLKVDIFEVLTHLKKPHLLIYICFVNLILLPVLIYFLFKGADPSLLTALFLLAALPTGVSSAAFTDIMEGKTSLNLSIIIVTNLLAVVTIPLLFWVFFETNLDLDNKGLFLILLKIFFIPFVIAKAIKHLISVKVLTHIQNYSNIMVVLLLSLMITTSISFRADFILQSIPLQLKNLAILFGCFVLFQIVGYFSSFWLPKGDKLAVSNSCMIMNNILGIVLSLAFFNDDVTTIVLLSLIPWNFMIIAKHWYKRYLP